MNEEQAVLDFFSHPDNLPLGLAVADLMDDIRVRMNNEFWSGLLFAFHALTETGTWKAELTEDKNAATQLVGVHFNLNTEQTVYLRPMIEQQMMGGVWRIYFGLIWSTTPSPEHLKLPSVSRLKEALTEAGFKTNESFLGWKWTKLHPRRQDFLLRLSKDPQAVTDEAALTLRTLLTDLGTAVAQANAALSTAPRSMSISLDQLRSKRPA